MTTNEFSCGDGAGGEIAVSHTPEEAVIPPSVGLLMTNQPHPKVASKNRSRRRGRGTATSSPARRATSVSGPRLRSGGICGMSRKTFSACWGLPCADWGLSSRD
jgi:hypothetical protein